MKVILIVLVGFLTLIIFLLSPLPLYFLKFFYRYWLKWQRSKIIALLELTENGQKFLQYCKKNNIELLFTRESQVETLAGEKIGFWGCGILHIQKEPIWALEVNKKDLKLMAEKNGIVEACIAHELGHIYNFKNSLADNNYCPYLNDNETNWLNIITTENSSCPYIEYSAWERGWQILQDLKIHIDEKRFWEIAWEAIKSYLVCCKLSDLKFCDKMVIKLKT